MAVLNRHLSFVFQTDLAHFSSATTPTLNDDFRHTTPYVLFDDMQWMNGMG